MRTPERQRHFASDNYAGICPEAWAAMAEANAGPRAGLRRRPLDRARRRTSSATCSRPTARSSSSSTAPPPTRSRSRRSASRYHSILCHETAHVETDECGAPEFFSNGTKVLTVQGDGRQDRPGERRAHGAGSAATSTTRSRASSRVTQATELGTVYRPDELAAIGARARAHGLRFHMDGARFANAVASLGVAPKELTWQAGVDVLCFGGTKNGMAVGRGGGLLRPRPRARVRLPLQAGRAARLEDALPGRPVGGDAARRRLAAARAARQRDGRPARGCASRDPRRPGPPPAARRTPSSPPCPRGPPTRSARAAGASTTSSAAARASCAPGTRPRTTSVRSPRTWRRSSRPRDSSLRAITARTAGGHHSRLRQNAPLAAGSPAPIP